MVYPHNWKEDLKLHLSNIAKFYSNVYTPAWTAVDVVCVREILSSETVAISLV
jgi:hypothetical protein